MIEFRHSEIYSPDGGLTGSCECKLEIPQICVVISNVKRIHVKSKGFFVLFLCGGDGGGGGGDFGLKLWFVRCVE